MEDKMSSHINETITKVANINLELEKTLSRYLIIGSLGSVGFILNFYQKIAEKVVGSVSFDIPLTLFCVSFMFGILFLVARLLANRAQENDLIRMFEAQLKFEAQQDDTSKFDPSVLPLHNKRKLANKKLDFHLKMEPIIFYITLFGGSLSFFTGFILSILTAVSVV